MRSGPHSKVHVNANGKLPSVLTFLAARCSFVEHRMLLSNFQQSKAIRRLLVARILWICGFRVGWKPDLAYPTFGCKSSACCFYTASVLVGAQPLNMDGSFWAGLMGFF